MEIILRDEVFRIIGAAIEVHKELGSGFLEALYHEALEMEFADRGIPFVSQSAISIRFKSRTLSKQYIADFLCFDSIIVEIKAISQLTTREESQMINYLNATGMRLGLLINFGSIGKLEWDRIIR